MLPHLTRAQVRLVDQMAIDQFGIPGIVLMENAAIGAAQVARGMLNQLRTTPTDEPFARPVLIICGGGNNGGDGLAISRHLHNSGSSVAIALASDPDRYKGDALINWNITQAMKLPTSRFTTEKIERIQPRLIVDAIFGTGLDRPPRDPFDQWAAAINASRIPVLAIDVPSGLDCDTGRPLGKHAIMATHTVTFVAEKVGFLNADARQYLGTVTVAGIGAPPELVQRVASQS